ncbi:preprotein translocase subunit SecE [Moraxella macacae 0408225]|uniref:Preprotein translocase subunit SecE n=1 Tax=Moraxella macacae 0408225 TaxID=1230338 RepID=L2FAD7_9GAMM|nr:preprotein translocase subunit SecE [Moraxella macacae]ELA09428.1 preprotein translocase subunit SecE [Moraxella macacae 0408225]
MKNMLEKKLAELNGERVSGEPIIIRETPAIEVAKRHSAKDIALWLYAIIALIFATLVNQYLPAYWQPASNVWTRIGVIMALIISAFIALAFTNQGSAFKTLLLDSRIELRRVTWSSKAETMQYTWQSVVVSLILAFLVWVLDMTSSQIMQLVIG